MISAGDCCEELATHVETSNAIPTSWRNITAHYVTPRGHTRNHQPCQPAAGTCRAADGPCRVLERAAWWPGSAARKTACIVVGHFFHTHELDACMPGYVFEQALEHQQ